MSVNGDTLGSFQSSSDSESTSFDIDTHDVKKLSLESIGLDKDEWVDLLEVRVDQEEEGYDGWALRSIVRPHVAAGTETPIPSADNVMLGVRADGVLSYN